MSARIETSSPGGAMSRQSRSLRIAFVTVLVGCLSACGGGFTSFSVPSVAPSATTNAKLEEARSGLPEAIRNSGVLTIGTYPQTAPGEYLSESGAIVGWEVELISDVARRLQLEPKFLSIPFGNIIPSVSAGSPDAGISSIFDTAERRAFVDMVDYYRGGTLWAALKDSTITPSNACGAKVAVVDATTQATRDLPNRSRMCVEDGKKPITIIPAESQEGVLSLVLDGQADACIGDAPVIEYSVQQSKGRLKVVGDEYDVTFYGIAVANDNSGLANAIRIALSDMKADGTYDRMLGKWGVERGSVQSFTISTAP